MDGWRKRRIVGYHGVVSPLASHRQSAAFDSKAQTGTPRAGDVDNRRVAGHDQIKVLHDGGGFNKAPVFSSISRPRSMTSVRAASLFISSRAAPFCRLKKWTFLSALAGNVFEREAAELISLVAGAAAPDDADAKAAVGF